MNKNKKTGLLIISLVWMLLVTQMVYSESCRTITTPGEIVKLTEDLTSLTTTCFTVKAPNVVIKCNGYSITGGNSQYTYGIYSDGDYTKVENCIISGYGTGIFFKSVDYGEVLNVNITSNIPVYNWYAIHLSNSNYNTIQYSVATMPYGTGIFIDGTSGNNIINHFTSTSFAEGVRIQDNSNYNLINKLNIVSNYTGVSYSLAYNNTLSNSIVSSTSLYAIRLVSASDNIIANTTLKADIYEPMRIETSSNKNRLINNTLISTNKLSTLLYVDSTSGNNIFYWNNFTNTNGYYVNDSNNINKYYYNIDGKDQGNIWYNVMTGGVVIIGSVPSSISGLYIGDSGAGYPYNSVNSLNKVTPSVIDYYPLLTTLLANSAPVMISARISPTNPSDTDDLIGYCKATDSDSTTLIYEYQMYLNGALPQPSQTGSYSQGVEVNVTKVLNSEITPGNVYMLRCRAYDGIEYSSWLNSLPLTFTGSTIPGWDKSECRTLYGCSAILDSNTNILLVNISNNGIGHLLTDYSFDVSADTSYNFSYTINNSATCKVNVSFYFGICQSYTDFTSKYCFITPTASLGSDLNIITSSKLLQIPNANSHATNDKYFKDVRLSLTFTGTCSNTQISNISLREQKYINDTIDYDMNQVPTIDITSENSCCPNDYCWNGTTCVNSKIWTTDSSMPGIWSNGDRGYRCVMNGTSAEWIFSKKHYDWDHHYSGYCPSNSDCFVEENFRGTEDCVATNTVINDAFEENLGNHYCYDGSWTTKTYLVAQLLINLTEGKPYVLNCHNTTDTTFNTNSLLAYENNPNILSTCVLIKQEANDPLTDQVISGIIAKDGTDSNLMSALINEYHEIYQGITTPEEYLLESCIDGTHDVPGTNFSNCFKSNNPKAPLVIYYEKNYNYFILSEKAISGLTPNTFWESIIFFFKQLISTIPIINNPFASMPLSDYENIYLASNNYGTVTAVEEQKYDSSRGQVMSVIFIRYNCSNSNYNIINRDEIIHYINESFVNVNVNDIQYLPGTGDNQELRITTVAKTGLWPYFTSTLRHRNDNGIGCTAGGSILNNNTNSNTN